MPTRIDRAMAAIQTNVEILKKGNIPFIFSAKPRHTVTHGTKNALDIFNRNVEIFEEAFIRDVNDMCVVAGGDDDANDQMIVQDDNIMKMKTPLSLANNNEIREFARYLIVRDRRIRIPDSNNKRIKYGDPTWRPSFWPDDMFCWTSSNKNFSDVRMIDLPGNHSILDVLREAIKRCLEKHGKDPENYFNKEVFTDEIKTKRIRNRGIISEQIIEDNETDEPMEVVTSEEAAIFVPRGFQNLQDTNDKIHEEEEVRGCNETALIVNADDNDDEPDVDNHVRTVRAPAEAAETESTLRSLRRSERNISLVTYSISSKSDLSTESEPSFAPSLDSSSESTLSDSFTSRRSKRTRMRKEVFDNSENDIKKAKRKQKALINESLERLIRPPSIRTQKEELKQAARQKSFDTRRKEVERQHEEEMSKIDRDIQGQLEKRKNAKEMSNKIKEKADRLRKQLSEKSLKTMFRSNLKYFRNIQKGLEKSWRHDMFFSSKDKAQKDRFLLQNSISQPFSNVQRDIIYNEIKQIWLLDQAMQHKNGRYVDLVLLPEVFITIYQKFFSLPSNQIAEQYMKDAGSLDPEDISPDSSLLI